MGNVNKILAALLVLSTQISLADIPNALVTELTNAKTKLDLKGNPKNKKTEPVEDNFKEFGKLVDKAYLELEADKTELLKLQKGDLKLKERISTWVKVAALATALDPSDSVVELSADIEKKFPLEFNESIQGLDQKLQNRFVQALNVFKRVSKNGNGG